jgi:hypothetical protein
VLARTKRAPSCARDVSARSNLHGCLLDRTPQGWDSHSTVGSGDIYPVTVVGHLVAVRTMIVGVSTFGVVTARIASALIRDGD